MYMLIIPEYQEAWLSTHALNTKCKPAALQYETCSLGVVRHLVPRIGFSYRRLGTCTAFEDSLQRNNDIGVYISRLLLF